MKLLDMISTANSNLRRNKLRTFLTTFSIVIGTITLSLSLGLGEGLRAYVKSQLGQFEDVNFYQVTKEGAQGFNGQFGSGGPEEYNEKDAQSINSFSDALMKPEDVEKIAQTPGVDSIRKEYGFKFLYVTGVDDKKYQVVADTAHPELTRTIVAGSDLTVSDKNKVLVSNKYLSILGVTASSEAIGKELTFRYSTPDGEEDITLQIHGVIEPTLFDSPFKVTEALAKDIYAAQNPNTPELFGFVFATRDLAFSEETLKENLLAEHYTAQSLKDLNNTINNLITGVQIGLAAFSGIAILASIVGVINTLFMAVLERTREIGLLRALGARKSTIFSLFSIEAVLIGIWGSLVGLLIANILRVIINRVAEQTFLKGVEGYSLLTLPAMMMLIIVAGIGFVTLLAGILPANKASRLDPIEALRHE